MTFDDSVRYQESHEWVRLDNGVATIGISDYAQDELGDVVFVELPTVGATLSKGDAFGVVESVKAASDLYMPVGGEVIEVNEVLGDKPETINDSPFADGWIIRVKAADPSEAESLMTAAAYRTFTEGLSE